MENNTLALLVTDAAAFAAAPLSASADTAPALLFRVAGAEQSTATAVVDIAYGVLLRRFKGIDKNSIGGGRGGRLKNYHTTANSLQKAGYSFDLQAAWLAPLRNAGKLSTWGQSVKNALAALESLQLIQAAGSDSSSDSSSSDSSSDSSDSSSGGAVSAALSDADRAGNIAAELIGQMSPETFDLLAAAVAQRMENDKAAQQRRDAAAAKRQAAADTAAAAKEKREKANNDAARIAELRRKADAADLAAIAADQAAKLPDATAATKKRAAKLLKAAQAAGAAYLAAVAA